MMSMVFGFSSSVMLLFDFWKVNGPLGMLLSVFVVTLMTVLYEVLKVWRVWLGSNSKLAQPDAAHQLWSSNSSNSSYTLNRSQSESFVMTTETPSPEPFCRKRFLLLHTVQAVIHILQVTLGYMVMLCVMSYNAWIFLGVAAGSALGYFISFPLLGQK